MRFQELMPDVLHWLGIPRTDRLVSMSHLKYNAIINSGIQVVDRRQHSRRLDSRRRTSRNRRQKSRRLLHARPCARCYNSCRSDRTRCQEIQKAKTRLFGNSCVFAKLNLLLVFDQSG
jgi:hypothetical protein